MSASAAWLAAAVSAGYFAPRRRLIGERGEGVISVAIAVLIMAFLGVAMWIGFRGSFDTMQKKTDDQITKIGT